MKKIVILFSGKCKTFECFNCYKYDYIEKMCKNVKKYEHFAKKHNTNRCNKKEVKITHKFVNCK